MLPVTHGDTDCLPSGTTWPRPTSISTCYWTLLDVIKMMEKSDIFNFDPEVPLVTSPQSDVIERPSWEARWQTPVGS